MTDERPDEPITAETDDTEGHSLSLLLGMDALDKSRSNDRARSTAPEEDPARPINAPRQSSKDSPRR